MDLVVLADYYSRRARASPGCVKNFTNYISKKKLKEVVILPCYQIRYTSVEFKAKNLDLLKQMLESEGRWYSEISKGVLRLDNGIILDTNTGQARIKTGQQNLLNDIKQKYSRHAINKVASKRRWHVKQLEKNKGKIYRY